MWPFSKNTPVPTSPAATTPVSPVPVSPIPVAASAPVGTPVATPVAAAPTGPVGTFRGAFQKGHIGSYLRTDRDFSEALKEASALEGSLHDAALGRAKALSDRAISIARVDGNSFIGARSDTAAAGIIDMAENIKQWKDEIGDFKAEGGTARNLRPIERGLQRQERDFNRIGKKVLADIAKGEKIHNDAITAFKTEKLNLLGEIDKEFFAEQAKVLNNAGAKATLEKNRNALKGLVEKQFEMLIDKHENHISEFKGIIEDVEAHTNLKYADFKKSAAAAVETLEKEAGTLEKTVGKPSHFGMTAGGAAAGAIVGYVASDDENKARNTVIGGVIGGALGRLISHFKQGAKVAMGAVSHDHNLVAQASKAVVGAASHMR